MNCPEDSVTVRADPHMLKAGWTPRFLADPDRAKEAAELYEKIGYEVKTQHVKPADFDERCGECPLTVCKSYVMIYTRPL